MGQVVSAQPDEFPHTYRHTRAYTCTYPVAITQFRHPAGFLDHFLSISPITPILASVTKH